MPVPPSDRKRTLVLADGAAHLCDGGPGEPLPIDRADLTAVLASGGETDLRPVPGHLPALEPWPDGAVVRPGAPISAVVGGGAAHVFLEDAGGHLTLTARHLDTWFAAQPHPTIATLVQDLAAPRQEVIDLLDGLRRIGAVELAPSHQEPPIEGPEGDAPDDPPPAGSSDRSLGRARAALARVQGRLRPSGRRRGDAGQATVVRPWLAQGDATPDAAAPEPARPTAPDEPARIPVYAFWATQDGPPVGSAAVMAYARVHDGGRLNDRYDLHKLQPPEVVLAALEARPGPAVLICGNYVWSVEANIEVARRARAINPDLVVIHGGPSTPNKADACEPFLRGLEGQHVAVVGEGEVTFAAVLAALADQQGAPDAPLDISVLEEVAGIRYLEPGSGRYVHTEDRARHATLEDFPSAFATGEFDLVPDDELYIVAMETNRGCPFSCTFCDWGSATMSRIRSFPMERIEAELAWMAARGIDTWYIADANFGLLPRDLEIAQRIAAHRETGSVPELLVAFPAKNASDRYLEIVDTFTSAGITLRAALALQTRDPATLDAVKRSNIKTDSYDRLVAESRRRGLPIVTELMVGLPGATVESLKTDLQWCIDHQVRAWIYDTVVLPNAPMAAPAYRDELAIRTIDGRVVSTTSFTTDDRTHMDRITNGYQCLEVFGTLRHVLRLLQWDHGIRMVDAIERIVVAAEGNPDRYPLLATHLRHARRFLVPPDGWTPLLDEARDLIIAEFGVPADSALDTAFAVTRHLLPWPGRSYPGTLALDHDYVAYFSSARQHLIETAEPGLPTRPLAGHGPGALHVEGDPLDVSRLFGEHPDTDPFLQAFDFELGSPVFVYASTVATTLAFGRRPSGVAVGRDDHPVDLGTSV